MSTIEGRQIELREGNATLRELISGALVDLGFDVVTPEHDEEVDTADLLIVDVDSGFPNLDERAGEYAEAELPVIHCGVRISRERFDDTNWLERPFTRFQLYEMVVEYLDVDRDEVESLLAADVPEGPATIDDLPEPITRELDPESAQEIEDQFGMQPGTLESKPSDGSGLNDLSEGSDATFVLDPDEDVIPLELGDGGGMIRSDVSVRSVGEDELRNTADQEMVHRGFRSPTFNQTMPETPAAIDHYSESTREAQIAPDLTEISSELPVPEEPTTNPLRSDPLENDVASQFKGVARALAESWDRIALTARTEDRAGQIERILRAALSRGVKGASEEIMRLPLAQGFSGNLEAMPAIDLLRTIRDRRLRGRLEIASHHQAYVLYLDGGSLEEIDSLSGAASSDEVLLEVLLSSGALDPSVHEELRDAYSSGDMMLPLENRLVRDNLVSDGALREARASRAKSFFRQICSLRRGQFAFIEVRPGDGAPWPPEPLRMSIDTILLELLREASFDTGDSRATSRTRLVLDPSRAAAVQPSSLTEFERRVLSLFRNPETVGQAREMLAKAPPEEVDRIVNRLKQLEILKRSDPLISIPDEVRDAASTHTSDTVVSDIADVIGNERARQATAPLQDVVAREDEGQTAQKASFDLGIVADRLEDDDVESLVASGIAAYEASESEAEDDG